MYRLDGKGYTYGDIGDHGYDLVPNNYIFSTRDKAVKYAEKVLRKAAKSQYSPEIANKPIKWEGNTLSIKYISMTLVSLKLDPKI